MKPFIWGVWLLRLLTFLWCFNSGTWSQGIIYSLKKEKNIQSSLSIMQFLQGILYRQLVLFLVIPRSIKSGSQNIAFSNFIKSYFTFTFDFITVAFILITTLAVILKLLYRCCYGVLIMNKFNWQTGKSQCFDCKKIFAYIRKFQTSK